MLSLFSFAVAAFGVTLLVVGLGVTFGAPLCFTNGWMIFLSSWISFSASLIYFKS